MRATPLLTLFPHAREGGTYDLNCCTCRFQALRERYDTVVAVGFSPHSPKGHPIADHGHINNTQSHTDFTHKVQLATEKEQRLQDEIKSVAMFCSPAFPPNLLSFYFFSMLLDAALASSPHSQLQSASTPIPTTPTPTPVHAQLSPLEPHTVPASLAPAPVPAHLNGHSSSVAPPHAHPHAHLHGHGYVANHTPSSAAHVPGSNTEVRNYAL